MGKPDETDTIESLKSSKSGIKGHFTRFLKQWKETRKAFGTKYPPVNVCENRLKDFEKNRESFNDLVDRIYSRVEDRAGEQEELEEYEKLWYEVTDEITDIIRKWKFHDVQQEREKEQERSEKQIQLHFQEQLKVMAGTHPVCGDSRVKLPPLEIPTFDGDYLEWPHFREIFFSAVHDTKFPNIQKLNLLTSKLKGNAARYAQGLRPTGDHYEFIWKQLNTYYDNSRALISAHLDQLFSIPKVTVKSHAELQNYTDTASRCFTQLEKINLIRDDILLHVMTRKLDPDTREAWELSIATRDKIPFDDFIEFMQKRVKATSMITPTPSTKFSKPSTSKSIKPSQPHSNAYKPSHSTVQKPKQVHVATNPKCRICAQEDHPIYLCSAFKSMSITDRRNAISSNKLCYNCFRSDHQASKCSSGKRCRTCNKTHHTLLHLEDAPSSYERKSSGPPPPPPPKDAEVKEVTSCSVNSEAQVLLATAVVTVMDRHHNPVQCRALIDLGSQANFVTEALAKKLGLPRSQSALSFRGVGENSSIAHSSLNLIINNHVGDYSLSLAAHVVESISSSLPSYSCPKSSWSFVQGLKLADPTFHQPNSVDLLFNAAIYAEIIRSGLRRGAKNTPVAQETALGWILFGPVPHAEANMVLCAATFEKPDDLLQKFWELEEVPNEAPASEEDPCEAQFRATHSRDHDGRYMVRLPRRPHHEAIGSSVALARKRMEMMERRFRRDPDLHRQYCDFMDEYLALGHMSQVDISTDTTSTTYYLPHHAVRKEDSATTKCRVVFDASARSSSGMSLNDTLMIGPTVQEDICSLLTRFRLHNIAIVADIAKMYRQFLVHPDDRPLQRILWRASEKLPMGVYQLNTITYGTASAPFQAIRCLQQLALDESQRFPKASPVTLRDFYVDNLLTGCNSEEEALLLYEELIQLMKAGQLQLRQWASNSPALMRAIPDSIQDSTTEVELNSEESVLSISTLGIKWKPNEDAFTYKIHVKGEATTKREVLSAIARIFDPLGWLSPVVVLAKLHLKTLWKLKLDWDDPVPAEVLNSWRAFEGQLVELKAVKIPRCLSLPNPISYELHGFGDASKEAYGAVLYIKTSYANGETLVRILSSKTRVSPVKEITIPKLELCAAVLLSQLTLSTLHSLGLEFSSINLWSDSSVTLCWLRDFPSRWKPFVANRVRKVRDLVPMANWRHVPGKDNPADHASRGLTPAKLLECSLWWSGPEWLKDSTGPFLTNEAIQEDEEVLCEQRAKLPKVHVGSQIRVKPILPDVSSYRMLIRALAWVLRFVNNIRKSKKDKGDRLLIHVLLPSELKQAERAAVRIAQTSAYSYEMRLIAKSVPILKKSPLIALNPFLDQDGLLRVGGRLRHSEVPYDQKNPVILPPVSLVTKLLIEEEHQRLFHGGTSLVLNSLHQRFWIVTGRNAVRHVLRRCMVCFRNKAEAAKQLMGDLPRSRVTPSAPFLHTGVDYAGPIEIADRRGRGAKVTKGYIVLFVCMATKAIHLELATELTTTKFLDSFRRFIAVRGRPSEMSSDCGTNFQGAVNQMKEVFELLRSSSKMISDQLSKEKIIWRFNPAAAPTFGGLWEAGVKSVKYHLKRVLNLSILTYEDYLTVLKQVEGCLNSRPLTSLPTEAEDPEALTPGHFLIGRPLVALPDDDYTEVPCNRLQRWSLQQKMFQSFWLRWSKEYLNRLQRRPKWWAQKTSLKVDDVVLVMDERFPPNQWPLGRIIHVHPGEDNLVRAVTVKTSKGTYQRPISKLAPLPFDQDDENTEDSL